MGSPAAERGEGVVVSLGDLAVGKPERVGQKVGAIDLCLGDCLCCSLAELFGPLACLAACRCLHFSMFLSGQWHHSQLPSVFEAGAHGS